ncbi:MAG: M15 family metallopeptidase [Acidobacteriota bacterium]
MYHIPAAAIRLAQKHLGFGEADIDAALDAGVEAALEQALAHRRDDLHPDHRQSILTSTSRRRKVSAFIQLLCGDRGIDAGVVDGYWGPRTDYAFYQLDFFERHGRLPDPFRDVEPVDVNPNDWPFDAAESLIEFYGRPGDESNIVSAPAPFHFKLAWNLSARRTSLRLHRKVIDSAVRVLERTLDHYGLDEIRRLRLDLFGGDYEDRNKRGGTTKSTHAWGIALDFDPERNPWKANRFQASFSRPDYDAWWAFWEEEGWTSLGRARNFDWMHVQAAKID